MVAKREYANFTRIAPIALLRVWPPPTPLLRVLSTLGGGPAPRLPSPGWKQEVVGASVSTGSQGAHPQGILVCLTVFAEYFLTQGAQGAVGAHATGSSAGCALVSPTQAAGALYLRPLLR